MKSNYSDLDDAQIMRLRTKGLNTTDKSKLRKIIGNLGKLGKGPYSPLATEAILSVISAQDDKDVEKFGLDILILMLAGKL
jgi:hypothetical protein